MNTDTGYLSKIMAMIIHTYNGTTPSCLQSFSLFQMNNSSSTSIPVLTSLEEADVLGYIQRRGDPTQGGRKSQGDKPNMLMESPSIPDLCLTELDLSLTECNYQSESWSVWHLNLQTEASTKTQPERPTCVEKRGRAQFPRLQAIMHS